MAEYVEVMEQKRRMCNSYALCSMGCPLNNLDFCNKNSGEKTNADFPEVERKVMSWAEEHPEPIYPLWAEWFRQIGVVEPTQKCFHDWLLKPIPADIAQKLGIEPKEG